MLLVVTFRPEFDPSWIRRQHVSALTLNRLAQRDTNAMIDSVVGNKLLPARVRQDIVERTDGIPLFVEEMTKAVLEAGGADEQTVGAVPSARATVPATLHASLMARLDRLGAAKEVAQISAAIGREFSHTLLLAILEKPEAELEAAFERLIAAGLLFRQGIPPHATYLFKHALVQDAAYSTLLREPRRALHARIVDAFEVQFPEIVENRPELVARHCSEAGLIEKSARLWGKAGQRSFERSALSEAAEQFTRALGHIVTLPATSALRQEEIKFQVALVAPLIHIKGFAAPETNEALERARTLIEQAEAGGEPPDDPLLLFSVLYDFWAANFVQFNGDKMCEIAAHFLARGEEQGAIVPIMVGNRLMGVSLASTGNLTQARVHYDRALPLYDPALHRSLATRFTSDIRVGILNFRTWTLWLLGYPDAALEDADQAHSRANEIGLASTLMPALNNLLLTRIFCGKYATANAEAEKLNALADEKGASYWKACGTLHQGGLRALTGSPADAIHMITSGITAYRSTGSTLWMPLHLSYLARAYAALDRFGEAWDCIREALNTIEKTKEKWFEAEANRVAGEVELMSPEPDLAKAQPYFERALTVAREQQAKAWELRAATSMARLWRDQGKRQQAHDLLAPIYSWFTEGFDTLDLKDAKALLGTLTL